jgi:hypothetical protein
VKGVDYSLRVRNSGTTLTVQGGQGMHFNVSNVNVLGTTITIAADSGESHSANILPLGSADLVFSIFGNEPMGWRFDISTSSSAFIVTWCLYSTWIPGDPPNPPVLASVQSVNPSAGPVGSTVTITGTNFIGTTDVNFGSAPATIQSSSDTEITVTVPNGSGTVDVVVVNGAGSSITKPADQFTYFPVPVVTGISPTSGTPGTPVTITGTGFTGVTDVGFGLSNVNIVSATDTEIVVNAPGGSGTVDITVTTPGGTSAMSPADQFTYTTPAAPPVVTSINPTSGSAGTSVTITGTGFTGVTDVGFGLANVNVLSATDTEIVVNAPGGDSGTTVDITVTTPVGTSATSPADQFTYN